jgi:hypothetical protein
MSAATSVQGVKGERGEFVKHKLQLSDIQPLYRRHVVAGEGRCRNSTLATICAGATEIYHWAIFIIFLELSIIDHKTRKTTSMMFLSPLDLLGVTGDRECCAPAYSVDA